MASASGGPTRTSFLAGLSLFSGIGAVMCVTTSWFLTHLAGLGDAAGFNTHEAQKLLVASKIVSWVTVGPAVLAHVFWLAARASIAESNGEVGGRGLYRTGVLVSIISVIVALSGMPAITDAIQKAVDGIAGISQEVLQAEANRGWLGVKVKSISSTEAKTLQIDGGAKVTKLLENSPAMGVLQVNDIIVSVNRQIVEDSDALTDFIGSCTPGSRVTLTIRRGGALETREVVLGSRYPDLLKVTPQPVQPTPLKIGPPKQEE